MRTWAEMPPRQQKGKTNDPPDAAIISHEPRLDYISACALLPHAPRLCYLAACTLLPHGSCHSVSSFACLKLRKHAT